MMQLKEQEKPLCKLSLGTDAGVWSSQNCGVCVCRGVGSGISSDLGQRAPLPEFQNGLWVASSAVRYSEVKKQNWRLPRDRGKTVCSRAGGESRCTLVTVGGYRGSVERGGSLGGVGGALGPCLARCGRPGQTEAGLPCPPILSSSGDKPVVLHQVPGARALLYRVLLHPGRGPGPCLKSLPTCLQRRLPLRNQEQLKRESFQAAGERCQINQKSSAALGGSPHNESRSISPLAIVFHFSSEVILIKLICMSIYR